MSAQEFVLNQTPVQISDGTKNIFIQEKTGFYTRFTTTTTSPTASTPYCVIKNGEVSIAKGFPVWVWARDISPSTIVVLMSEE